jgi:hypothetical protein
MLFGGKMKLRFTSSLLVLLAALLVAPAIFAGPVTWTSWNSTGTNQVSGTLGGVGVTYSGGYFFAQTNNMGIDYWNPQAAYLSGTVSNAPDSQSVDIIAIGTGGQGETITFSSPVTNPILAVISVNGPGLYFSAPFNVLSDGCGYWGCGNLYVGAGNLLYSNGEGTGAIQFPGTFTQITINEQGSENWRGFTVGVLPTGTPEPGTLVMFGSGILGLAGILRRKINM